MTELNSHASAGSPASSHLPPLTRRQFVRTLGAGLLIAVCDGALLPTAASAQAAGGRGNRGGGGGGGRGGRGGGFGRGGAPTTIAARLHIARDGVITVLTSKVECGQGSRAELTQAAAEELRVSPEKIVLIMADTGLVPDDGMTAGSRSTPSSVPAIRHGAAAAREVLAALAAKRWGVPLGEVEAKDGKIVHTASRRELPYGDLAAADDEAVRSFAQGAGQNVAEGIAITPVKDWKVLGTAVPRPNRRDLVTGGHHYPSDVSRPGMLYGKVLRAPAYGATLASIDLGPAKAMSGVVAFQDGSFVGVAAPTSFRAAQALSAIEQTAKWDNLPDKDKGSADDKNNGTPDRLYDLLRRHVRGGVPANPFAGELAKAAKSVKATYHVAYIQHAPLEPRAAVAEWSDGGKEEKSERDSAKAPNGHVLTVWTGTQNPFGVRSELSRAFGLNDGAVRVIVPDFGGGFGGKHSGEAAVEAARLAKAAGKPVHLRWTRQEEFTWAYFRPAGVIDAEAGLNADGSIASWYFININSGQQAIEPPYRVGKTSARFVGSEAPLRHGSYRALASTANTFARECFMDELAEAAGKGPLEFRLSHLQEPRLRAVLEEAAKKFDWAGRSKKKEADVGLESGVGLACGTEKGSFVAACAEVVVDRKRGRLSVRRVCQAFECGAVLNPGNLTSQNQGAIVMGLGAVLREAIEVGPGKVLNASFSKYLVPRFEDVPEVEVHLLDRPDLPSSGAGETPIIAVGPAVANAVSRAIGQRVREMPMRLPGREGA